MTLKRTRESVSETGTSLNKISFQGVGGCIKFIFRGGGGFYFIFRGGGGVSLIQIWPRILPSLRSCYLLRAPVKGLRLSESTRRSLRGALPCWGGRPLSRLSSFSKRIGTPPPPSTQPKTPKSRKVSKTLRANWGRGSGGVKSAGVSQSVRETGRDESQSVLCPETLLKTSDLELPIFEGSLPSCSPHSAGYTRTSVHPYFPVAKPKAH